MPVGAVMAVGTAVSAGVQANAANKAAKVQKNAANQARADFEPFRLAGQSALSPLQRLNGINPDTGEFDPNLALTTLQGTPGYQFAFDEGGRALQTLLGKSGQLRGGNAVLEAQKFGQGLATQTLNNERGALAQLAGIGAGAAGGSANSALQAGQAQASGIVGGANAVAGGIGNFGNFLMMQNQQQQQQAFLQSLVRPSSVSTGSGVFAGSQPVLGGFSGPASPGLGGFF